MSNTILTYTGIRINPTDPNIEHIRIEDIAHALSLMTRANGHIQHFYSVAQHTVNCCKEAQARGYNRRVRLACLLHDASECYLSDITRPVKQMLPAYLAFEATLQSMIYEVYNLSDLNEMEREQVSQVDDAVLYHEFNALRGVQISSDAPATYMEHDFSQRDFFAVEDEFLALFRELVAEPVAEPVPGTFSEAK